MLIDRYSRGEYEDVWSEIGQLSQANLSAQHIADIQSVAVSTMYRVAANVDLLIDTLTGAGWRFAHPKSIREKPTVEDTIAVGEVEKIIGPLPIALKVCLLTVGGVDLAGSWPERVTPTYLFAADGRHDALLSDPLNLPTARWLQYSVHEWQTDYEGAFPFSFEFAPDAYHKANYSGGSYTIDLPQSVVDPIIDGVHHRPAITLVEYLRTSFRWSGFPGYEFILSEPMPDFLTNVAAKLLPF